MNKDKDGNIVIASDSRMVRDYIDKVPCTKVFEVETLSGEKIYVAGAGEYANLLSFLDWVGEGMDKNRYPNDLHETANLFIISKHGVYCYENSHSPIKSSMPFASGSGGHIALGAMEAGASPEKSVKIASKYDPYTDSRVKRYIIPCKKAKASS